MPRASEHSDFVPSRERSLSRSGYATRALRYLYDLYITFRGELVIVLTALSLALAVLGLLVQVYDPLFTLVATVGIGSTVLLFGLLFNLKRFFRIRFEHLDTLFQEYRSRLETVDKILFDVFGFSWRENQYFVRREHFPHEKQLLARILVEQVLPSVVGTLSQENARIENLNVILDSGTTIAPVFPHLIRHSIRLPPTTKLHLYTNSLGGIDEIHKLRSSPSDALTERQFNLIGGLPLNKYRATTGDLTQEALKRIWDAQRNSDGTMVSIGITTANWILGGRGLDHLQVCARGVGHFDFKESLILNCTILIVIAPLGKLLRINHVDKLNALLPTDDADPYRAFEIPASQRNSTYLLTSFRPSLSVSPLLGLSTELKHAADQSVNFRLCSQSPEFDPQGTLREIIVTELPHRYIRDNFETAYGYPASTFTSDQATEELESAEG